MSGCFYSHCRSSSVVSMGVRRGGSGGQPPPRAWKISGQELVAQKSWMLKKYLNIVKNSRATLFFRAGPGCSKILHNKKYIFCTMNSGHPMLFRAIANCSKLLNVKSIFNTVKNFRGKCFQGKRNLLKILKVKSTFTTVKIFRATLCFFQDKRKLLKNREL